MMTSSLRAKFEQLGRVKEDDRVLSGSPATVTLRLGADLSACLTISAVRALRRRHVPTLKAKRAVEAVIHDLAVTLEAPMVEDADKLVEELRECGFRLEVRAKETGETQTVEPMPAC